jgi:hypothetical protein
MPPFEQFGVPLLVTRIVYCTAKSIENASVDASSMMLAQSSIHSLRVLVSKLGRIVESYIPQMPSQIRPNPGYVLKQIPRVLVS